MIKYERVNRNTNKIYLESILVSGEKVIWRGKPKKRAFVINKILAMFPLALIWLLFDGTFIGMMIASGEINEMLWFIIPFFGLHLMPVWIWLSNVLTASKRWENTEYAVTDKRIIIMSGFIGMDYKTIYYKDIENIHLKVGFIDKLLGVGDIYFDTNDVNSVAFLDIERVYELYPKFQKIVLDIQTDIEFPNNLRPQENDGYNTKYNYNNEKNK